MVEDVQWQVDSSRPPALEDLTKGRLKAGKYLEWRQREGSTVVPRCAGFPLSFTIIYERTTGSGRSLTVGVNPLWGSRILHQSVQLTTNALAFGCNLFAGFLSEHHHKSQEVKRFEQTVVILPIDDDVIIGGQKLLADTREGLLVQLLTSLTQQIDLKEVIGQHDKDDLIDDHREGTGSEMGQVGKALELTIPLLC